MSHWLPIPSPRSSGITRDPFYCVHVERLLAILGLRALYFLLAGVIDRLRFLDEGLAIVLVFIGGKMIGEGWLHIPGLCLLALWEACS